MGRCDFNLKLSYLVLVKVLVIGTAAVFVSSVDDNEFYGDERNGLISFREAMVSPMVDLHRNWTGPPCYNNVSRWVGISCLNSHVTRLVFDGMSLTGSLPPAFLDNITFLTQLSLANNSIVGNLPNLTNLVRIEYVSLSANRLSGLIPYEYTNLPNLIGLELQKNVLEDGIPAFNQQSLTSFNVSYNKLSGQIPETSVLERFPKSSYDHNQGLCGRPLEIPCTVFPPPVLPPSVSPPPVSPPPVSPPSVSPHETAPSPTDNPTSRSKEHLTAGVIVLIAAAAALVPFLVIFVFIYCYRRFHGEKTKKKHPSGGVSKDDINSNTHWSGSTDDAERTLDLEFFDKDKPTFNLDDLLRASAEVLGKGELGTTYKATLESGSHVAVKRLKDMNCLSKKEFVQQMQFLGNLRHPNLVEIISFYYSKEEKLVIHEFVQGRSLFDLLHENRGTGRLPVNWNTRLSIMKDVAKGLIFLHQSLSSHKVPHANLKSSNILLSRDYQSKLSDFGYLPLLTSHKSSERLAIGKSPEFVGGKKLTYKADVYCFGAVLLEVITGKLPGKNHEDLADWVRAVVNSDWSMDIMDVEILAERDEHEEMLKLAELALECTDAVPEKRPMMPQVLMRLEEIHSQLGQDSEQ